jgi:hypothetical protein
MLRRILIVLPLTILGVLGSAPAWAAGSTPGHFSYTDPTFGAVTCNEVHHPSSKLPANFPAGATTAGGYDTIECRLARPSLAGQAFTSGWASDFGTRFDQSTGFILIKVSGSGRTYHGIAWYPNG